MAAMDQDTAKRLFAEGAVLIVLDMPVGTEFGIDYNSWNVGPQFKGVKMIPPGVHFVYYSAVSTDRKKPGAGPGKAGPRTGFFVHLEKCEVVVKRWNPATEDLDPAATTEEELSRFRANLLDLDRFLGPYPFDDGLRRWLSLTGHVSRADVARMTPLNGKICSVSTFVPAAEEKAAAEASASAACAAAPACADAGAGAGPADPAADPADPVAAVAAGDDGPGPAATDGAAPGSAHGATAAAAAAAAQPDPEAQEMQRPKDTVLRFCRVPRRCHPPDATAAEITRCSMDKSYTLDTVLRQLDGDQAALLGELQFSFVTFLLGHVYDSFEQWKQIVAMLTGCEDALAARPGLFHDFIGVLHYQLLEAPSDFFVDVISTNNFLAALLQNFFEVVRESAADLKLKQRAMQLQQMVTMRFQWNFADEDDEDMPQVVDLPPGVVL